MILPANFTDHRKEDDVQWLYKENTLIARLNRDRESKYDCDDGRFRERLRLNNKTGSLTITDVKKIHSGHFKLKINKFSGDMVCRYYKVTVHGKFKHKHYIYSSGGKTLTALLFSSIYSRSCHLLSLFFNIKRIKMRRFVFSDKRDARESLLVQRKWFHLQHQRI